MPKSDLWGELFEVAATAVIFLSWLVLIGLGAMAALLGYAYFVGAKVTVTGSPLLAIFIPVGGILLGRFLRSKARSSVPARIGIVAVASLYVAALAGFIRFG